MVRTNYTDSRTSMDSHSIATDSNALEPKTQTPQTCRNSLSNPDSLRCMVKTRTLSRKIPERRNESHLHSDDVIVVDDYNVQKTNIPV